MFRNLLHRMKGDRKYFTIVFFIIVLILISAIVTPKIIRNIESNWQSELDKQIGDIQEKVNSQFENRMSDLLNINSELKLGLRSISKTQNEVYRELIKVLNKNQFEDYSVSVFAPNGRMIAWNNQVVMDQENLFPLNYPIGEIYFLEKDLITYLSLTDTLFIENDVFYLSVSTPIEKNYNLSNKYYSPVSFTKDISDKFQIDFEILYNPFYPKSKDGKKYSFEILNNAGNKIGIITFLKPALSQYKNEIKEITSKIQSSLVVLLLFFTGLSLRKDVSQISSRAVKLLFLIIYLGLARYVFYVIGFPSEFLSGSFTDPANFSSVFGWGIVKSPIEFLITNLLVLFLARQIYKHSISYYQSSVEQKNLVFRRIISFIQLAVFFLLLRSLYASIKSVIFDSTIRYFKDPNLIPTPAALLMNLNILILAVSIILCLIAILFVVSKAWNINSVKNISIKLLSFLLVLMLLSFAFHLIQNDPLIPLFLSLSISLIVILLFSQIKSSSNHSPYNYIIITLAASIISVTLLNYFNTKLERESLKTTAYEVNRANENLLQFMLNETIEKALSDDEFRSVFNRKFINYDAVAFKLWSESPIQRESMNSHVIIYDANRNLLGKFIVGMPFDHKKLDFVKTNGQEEILLNEIQLSTTNDNKAFEGIVPFYERGILKGFLSVSVSFDLLSIGAQNYPDFLESSLSILNKVLNINQLLIFELVDDKLTQVFGDRYPSREQIKQIINTDLSELNDGWTELDFDGEKHVTFILKSSKNGLDKITTVSVAEKEFSWNLFNFFKIFIIHSFFILLLFCLLFVVRIRKVKYTFKSKLLIAFLLISIIPVIALAIYNREVVNKRGQEAIISELKQRSLYIENHLNSQRQKHIGRDLQTIFDNAAKELNISFAVYQGIDQIYNSREIFNQISLFDRKLNSQAHYHLNYLKFKEYLTSEKIENFNYDAHYRSIFIDDEEFIISVNDAFNKIRVSFSTVEIDVFIFGIYSFAVIIIIIISTIFANQISYPIRRLTKAAESVGQGDFNVKIEHNEKGELKDLLEGFNAMTTELQKNQAELAELEREAAWKEMAKQVAHEIKNPLTPMKLAIQQLVISYKDKSKEFDGLFNKVSGTILNQIESLSQIASEFSRFAKMPGIKLEKIELNSLLADVANLYTDEKIKIQIDCDTDQATVEADKSHLRRVFINLIRNSIQAEASRLNITLKKQFDNFYLNFEDNGIGIIPENINKIFDESFTTKKQGMGIGLALSKKFIENINGEIKLLSSESGKTVFQISIPAVISDKQA